MITEGDIEGFLFSDGGPKGTVALLGLISLYCQCQAVQCLPLTAFSLLSDLVLLLSAYSGFADLRTSLLECLSNAHEHCQATSVPALPHTAEASGTSTPKRINKTWNDADVCHIVLSISDTTLDLAGEMSPLLTQTKGKLTFFSFKFHQSGVCKVLGSVHFKEHRPPLFLRSLGLPTGRPAHVGLGKA